MSKDNKERQARYRRSVTVSVGELREFLSNYSPNAPISKVIRDFLDYKNVKFKKG